jgi:hypothetical protein
MSSYEYTVIPAPARGEKAKGARTGIERFAATLADALNDMAGDGWEYVRAEVLPAEERSGLTSRNTVYHNLLVFRRALHATPDRVLVVEEHLPATPPAMVSETSGAVPDRPSDTSAAQTAPVRAPFSQPMRAMPKQQPQPRNAEPPLSAPSQSAAPAGPRLGPATR